MKFTQMINFEVRLDESLSDVGEQHCIFVRILSISILDSVRNFRKNAARCLSDKDETKLFGLSVFLSADVWS